MTNVVVAEVNANINNATTKCDNRGNGKPD